MGFDRVLPMVEEHRTVAAAASCLVVAFDQAVDLAVDEEAAFAVDAAFLEGCETPETKILVHTKTTQVF